MKKIFCSLLTIVLISCTSNSSTYEPINIPSSDSNVTICTYNGHTLYTGSQGGCYYYNSNGNKQYVDHSYCNCN